MRMGVAMRQHRRPAATFHVLEDKRTSAAAGNLDDD